MKKILSLIIAAILGGFALAMPLASSAPALAATENTPCTCADGSSGTEVPGAILHYCDCGNGESIKAVLSLVVNIMTVGIGILGAIGLTVSGIQYLTAGGNEEQTRKAKRRIFEIVIGLAVYVTIYAILNWLIPDFHTF